MTTSRGWAIRAAVRDPCVSFPNHGPKTKRRASVRFMVRLAPEQEALINEVQAQLAAEGLVLSKADIVRASISGLRETETETDDQPNVPNPAQSVEPVATAEPSPTTNGDVFSTLPFKPKE